MTEVKWLLPQVLAPFLAIAEARRASLVCRAAARPATLVLARIASGEVGEAWLYRALMRRRTPSEVVLALLAAAPAAAQWTPRPPRPAGIRMTTEQWERLSEERLGLAYLREDDGLELPLHAALRLQKPARVLLALLAAYPAAAARREQPYENRPGLCLQSGWRYGTGAYPLVLAIRTGADVEVVRALIEAYPAALRAYSGDDDFFFDSDISGLPLHEAIYHSASPAVVQLLVDAYPEALLAESKERDPSELECPTCGVNGVEALGTPLSIAEELAYKHAQGNGEAVDPAVLALLRAQSRALNAPPVEQPGERARKLQRRISKWREQYGQDGRWKDPFSSFLWDRWYIVSNEWREESRLDLGPPLPCDRGHWSRARITRHAQKERAQRAERREQWRAGQPEARRHRQERKEQSHARRSATRPGRSAKRLAALAE